MQSNQGLARFAEALIAELAKQNEPVVCRYKDHNVHWCFIDKQYGNNEPLYTYPPTAEQIANETAEAIAEYCRNQDHYCLATEIESGAWKEFK